MSLENKHIRHGIGAVRPYIFGNLEVPEFVKQVFGGEELERAETGPNEFHVEIKIGDSVVVIETGKYEADTPRSSVYVYVEDVDAAYARAVQAGATSLGEPTDKPYQERGAGVKDPFGNTWWLATYNRLI